MFVSQSVVGLLRTNEYAIRRDVHRRRLDQPHVPVDPRPLIPPPFHVRRIDAHGDDVQLVAECRDVGDVDGERRVAAEVAVKRWPLT